MFEYPLNVSDLLNKTLSIKNKLNKTKKKIRELNIYVLCGSTSNKLIDILELFLLNNNIKPNFKISDYDRYYETALFKRDEIKKFKPDFIYIHTSIFNLKYIENSFIKDTEFQKAIKEEFRIFKKIWSALDELNCTIIQNNFEFPLIRKIGNFDSVSFNGKTKYVIEVNKLFSEHSLKNKKLIINDINYLSSLYGLEKWFDYNLWFSYKYAFSYNVIPYVAQSLFNIIKFEINMVNKVLITDLDNTLWGGVIGDDGYENIKVGNEDPISESYLQVQQYLKQLSVRGIILGIISKNNYKNAIEGFKNKNSLLQENDFSIIKANWKPKNINMKEIIEFLNISEDQVVYLDDSKFEREIIKKNFKKIAVPNIQDPEDAINFILFLDRNYYFQTNKITNEDTVRNKYYKQIEKWNEEKDDHQNYNNFLKKMKMSSTIYSYDEKIYERVFQLINKTNQFNLLKSRVKYTLLKKQLQDKKTILVSADLKDKFGNYGLTNIIIGKVKKDICNIEHWVMSCRVFDRTFENFIFNKFAEICQKKGIKIIKAKFVLSEKNILFKNVYLNFGFKNILSTKEYTEWHLDLKNFTKSETCIASSQ